MHPSIHAVTKPGKAALIMASSGEVLTFDQLDRSSNQGAHVFRGQGLKAGDTIAIFLENHPRFLEVAWAAQRAGLLFVCVPSRLTEAEVEYILSDSGARLVVTSPKLTDAVANLVQKLTDVRFFMLDEPRDGVLAWESACAAEPDTPIADERAGTDMLYSSGTTGRPKGVRAVLPDDGDIAAHTRVSKIAQERAGLGSDTIYLCPAPLYHAAPLRWSMAVQRLGGTVIVMEAFDPEQALALIERYRVTASQWVPTHFSRLLQLPEPTRTRYDLSSLSLAVHAAAPCPVPVKQAMIDWWGPILFEYYSATEANGMTAITSDEWLVRPGSVGKSINGIAHICDEEGHELPPRSEGLVYFEGGNAFAYHNDPEKTAQAANRQGWTTVGDIGWIDEEGYLYLTDRKSFLIISGGVNIYPQEIENLLAAHPKIADAAVIGAPDPDMGEMVVAVVQPRDWQDATETFAGELQTWLRGQLSGVKVPRQIDFRKELPRLETGKLYKRLLRDEYWKKAEEPSNA